jgi:hypothetical protein
MTKNQLSKVCINCSLQKPLTAYLQITGPQGSTYGNICSTCRGSGLGKKVTIPVHEDTGSSSSSTGLKIDAKAKLQADLEKKEALEKRKEAEKKEREELDKKNEAQENRKTAKKEKEEKHRQEFIEPNKAKSYIDYQSKTPEDKRTGMEKRAMEEIMQHTEDNKLEDKKKGFDDLTVTRIDPTQTGTIKQASAVWKQFRTLLGASAGVNIIEGQLENDPNRKDALLESNNMDVTRPNDNHPHKKDAIPSATSAISDQHTPQPTKADNTPPAQRTMFNNAPNNAPQQPQNQNTNPNVQNQNSHQHDKPEPLLNFGAGVSKREGLLNYVEKNFETEKPAPTSPGSGRRR